MDKAEKKLVKRKLERLARKIHTWDRSSEETSTASLAVAIVNPAFQSNRGSGPKDRSIKTQTDALLKLGEHLKATSGAHLVRRLCETFRSAGEEWEDLLDALNPRAPAKESKKKVKGPRITDLRVFENDEVLVWNPSEKDCAYANESPDEYEGLRQSFNAARRAYDRAQNRHEDT